MRASDRSAIAVTISVMLACLTVTPLTSDSGFLGSQLGLDHRHWRGQPRTAAYPVGERRSAERPGRDLADLFRCSSASL